MLLTRRLGAVIIAVAMAATGLSGCAVLGLSTGKGTAPETAATAESSAAPAAGSDGEMAPAAPCAPPPAEESASDGRRPPASPAPRKGANRKPSGDCYELWPSAVRRGKKTVGRCEPQSLPYARCRSGVFTCRMGTETGPLDWFACEHRRGNTSDIPMANHILILAANIRRKMPTGHVAYVEDVIVEAASVYRLILSHTNYDRKCALETRFEARYDRARMTLDVLTGAWKGWAQGLKVEGFISG